MIDLLFSPLYACNMAPGYCNGCWITEAGITRDPAQHTAQAWLRAIAEIPRQVHKIDICGGEPLLWDGLLEFCRFSLWDWAITTNLQADRYLSFITNTVPHALCFTLTYHPESGMSRETFEQRVALLKAAYPGRVNLAIMSWSPQAAENAEWFRSRGHTVALEPYEPTPTRLSQTTYCCDGGRSFAYLAPNGDVYPCVDSERARANRLGNLFRRDVAWPTERLRCNLACNSFENLPQNHPSGDVHTLKVSKL